MRFHQLPSARAQAVAPAKEFGVDEIDRADVQGGGHAHPAAALHESLDAIEAGLAVVQAAVNVRAAHVNEVRGVHHGGSARHESNFTHGGLARLTAHSLESPF